MSVKQVGALPTSATTAAAAAGGAGGGGAAAATDDCAMIIGEVSRETLERLDPVGDKKFVMAQVKELKSQGEDEKAKRVFRDWQIKTWLTSSASLMLVGKYTEGKAHLINSIPKKSGRLEGTCSNTFCHLCNFYLQKYPNDLELYPSLVDNWPTIEGKVQILLKASLVATEAGNATVAVDYLLQAALLAPEQFEMMGAFTKAMLPDGAFRGSELVKDLRPWCVSVAQEFTRRKHPTFAQATWTLLHQMHPDTADWLPQMQRLEKALKAKDITDVAVPFPSQDMLKALAQSCPFSKERKKVRETHHCVLVYNKSYHGPHWMLSANPVQKIALPEGYRELTGGEVLYAKELAKRNRSEKQLNKRIIFTGDKEATQKGRVYPVLRFFDKNSVK